MSQISNGSSFNGYADMSSEAPSYRYQNEKLLLKAIIAQLSMTDDDLDKEPSWVKAKLREANIDKIFSEK